MDNIIFDFDGTLAKTTQFHKVGWDMTLEELCLSEDLSQYLPYEKGLLERYDSYRRIREGFLKKQQDYSYISDYFNEENEAILAHRILDLKESFTISAILTSNPVAPKDALAKNLIESLDILMARGIVLGVLSSSRRALVRTFLKSVGIDQHFRYVLGEEDMTTADGRLMDKPDPYASNLIMNLVGIKPTLYIGDNIEIDQQFATNIGAKFILTDYSKDFKSTLKDLC